MKRLLFAVAVLPVAIIGGCQSLPPSKRMVGEAIEACLSKLGDLGKPLGELEGDRAYVFFAHGQADVIFSEGEMGWFGPRSAQYTSSWVCSVGVNAPRREEFEIRYLGYRLEEPVTHLPGTREVQDMIPADEIQVYLFMRTGDVFEYQCERSFDSPPTILDRSTDAIH